MRFLWGNFFQKVPPYPFKNFRATIIKMDFYIRIDGRRKRLGTAETLSAKRAVWRQSEPSERPVPTKFVYPIVGTGVLDGPSPLKNIAYKNGIALAIPFSAFYSALFSSFFLSKRIVPIIADVRLSVSPMMPPSEKKMKL